MANKTFSTSTVTQNPFNRGMADKNAGAVITITNSAGSPTTYNLSSTNSISLTSQGYYTLTTDRAVTLFTQLWGAGGAGGLNNSNGASRGSAGGYVQGNVSLLPSTTYVILVGQGGRAPASSTGRSFPDGGQNEQANAYQGGGGGSTRFGLYSQSGFNITNTSSDYNNTNAVYLLIAGAGGGGADYVFHSPDGQGETSGYGGGTNGANGGGYYSNSGEYVDSPGFGGSQSAGGNGGQRGRLSFSQSGSKYYGGNGSGGGGGGGYYGGGGARGYYSQGGGGSGFINSSVIDGRFFTTTAGADSYYISPNPLGNRPSSTSGFGGIVGSGNTGYDGAISFSLPSTTSVVSLTSSTKLGRSPETAAFSAKEIYNSGVTTNGDYWVKGSGSNPYKVFCLMDRLGGGWTRVMRLPRKYDTQDRNYYTFTEGVGYDTYSTGPFNLASSLFGNTNGTDLTVMYRVVGGATGLDFPGRLCGAMYRGYYLTEAFDAAKPSGSYTNVNPQYSIDGINFVNYISSPLGKANDRWNIGHSHFASPDIGGYNYNGQAAGVILHGFGPTSDPLGPTIDSIYTYVDGFGSAQGNTTWQYIDIYIRKDL